jgi:hypothetical protein
VPAFARPVIVAALFALGAVALGGGPAGAAVEQDVVQQAPPVVSGEAQDIGATSVTLTGTISGPAGTQYHFEYGPTADFPPGTPSTPIGTLSSPAAGDFVSATVIGLTPATTYHYRLVAWHPDMGGATEAGAGRSFATRESPPASDASPPAAQGPPPEPEINQTVAVAPVGDGTVKVKEPGTGEFTSLPAGEEVRLGSVVDTRNGAVKLTSELPGGGTQSATFGDGLFQVRQSKTRRGLIDIILRGGNFSVCRTRGRGLARVRAPMARAAVAVQSRKRPKRRLWAKDRGGRFRTHGRNSVATVRGTRWVTTDTCKGTRTTVTQGSVSVRNLQTERTVIVRKGKTYLARGRR